METKFTFYDLRQSPEWGEFLKSLGWEVGEYQAPSGRCQILIRKIPFIGSIIKIQRPSELINVESINGIARRHRALFLKIEPQSEISENLNLKKDSWPLLPTRTIWIDLTKSEKQLIKRMKKDTRYCIRRSERKNLSVSNQLLSEDNPSLREFYSLLKKTGRRGKFWVPPFRHLEAKARAFGSKGLLVTAISRDKNEMLAGAMILLHKTTAFYHHAASSKEGQKNFAPYAVMWETIKSAKRQGCNILDLEGIYDPRYSKTTKGWRGFTHFKKGFGGETIEFPGSYTKHFNVATKVLFR